MKGKQSPQGKETILVSVFQRKFRWIEEKMFFFSVAERLKTLSGRFQGYNWIFKLECKQKEKILKPVYK